MKLHYLFILIGIFILAFTFYKSEVLLSGDLRSNYFSKYLIGLCSLIIFFIINIFDREFKKIFNLSIFILILLTHLINIYIFIDFKFIKKFNHSSVGEYIKSIESNEKTKKYPALTPNHYINEFSEEKDLVLGGMPNVDTVVCNENGYFFEFKSDRYGLNNNDDVWDNSNEFLIVGDSFAFGSCVKDEFSIRSLIKKILNKGVVNIAYRSNGPLLEFLSLKYFINKSKTKKVLWFFYEGNDYINLKQEASLQILKNKLYDFQDEDFYTKKSKINLLTLYENKSSEFSKEFSKRDRDMHLNDFIDLLKLYYIRNFLNYHLNIEKFLIKNNQNNILDEELKKTLSLIINNSAKLVQENNMDLYFIYIPSIENILKRNNEILTDEKNYLKSLVQQNGIKFIDTSEIIYSVNNPRKVLARYQIPGHFSDYGYKIIVNYIIREIK